MPNKVENQLTASLLKELQHERYVTIATIDHETGMPSVNAISWIYAPNEKSIYFAVDNRSRIVENIKVNPKVTLTLIAEGSTYSISGYSEVKIEKLQDIPLKLALLELRIDSVRDVMFYGSKITHGPTYEKTYDKEAAQKLDNQVMDAMKKA